jgi:hypothetical protein
MFYLEVVGNYGDNIGYYNNGESDRHRAYAYRNKQINERINRYVDGFDYNNEEDESDDESDDDDNDQYVMGRRIDGTYPSANIQNGFYPKQFYPRNYQPKYYSAGM